MHGEGIFTWPNGRKYIGEFVNDKKEGYGIHEWYILFINWNKRPDGRKYKGFWRNGKRHGDGEFYYPRQKTWKKGVWIDDVRTKTNNESVTTTQSAQLSY